MSQDEENPFAHEFGNIDIDVAPTIVPHDDDDFQQARANEDLVATLHELAIEKPIDTKSVSSISNESTEVESLLSKPEASDDFHGVSGVMSNSLDVLDKASNKSESCSLVFLQQFFNVNSMSIMKRVKNIFLPSQRFKFVFSGDDRVDYTSFFSVILDNPDFYGPFWISTTLIFMLCVAKNIAQFENLTKEDAEKWHSDLISSSTAITIVYGFFAFISLSLWLCCTILGTNNNDEKFSLSSCICFIGYTLVYFFPSVIISMYPSNIVQWVSFLVAGFLCSAVILIDVSYTTSQTVISKNRKYILSGVVLSEFLLFAFLLKYFMF